MLTQGAEKDRTEPVRSVLLMLSDFPMLMFPCFSCDERTEHANSLDHAIALHLLKAAEDGSPLVRKELVVALQVGGSNPVLES